MKPIFSTTAFAIALVFTGPSTADCEQPGSRHVGKHDDYGEIVQLKEHKLKKALNARIRKHPFQDRACLPAILEALDPNAGEHAAQYIWPRELGFPRDIQDAGADLHNLHRLSVAVHTGSPEQLGIIPGALRGRVARALFYMDVRYNGEDATLTPDLELVSQGSGPGKPQLEGLCTLLDWNREQPVSAREQARNQMVFQWQGNRNPFIDHPQFADAIWSTRCAGKSEEKQRILQRIKELGAELETLKRRVEEVL